MSNTQLENLALFASLPEDEKKILSSSLTIKTFEPGTDICVQGQVASSCFIIVDGIVRIYLAPDQTNASVNAPDELIATMSENEFFGEVALLQGGKRSATCRAGPKGVTVAELGRQEFDLILQSRNTFAYRLLDVISSQLAKYTIASVKSLQQLMNS
jgi:CRP-like cAMP-binding protein